MRAGLWRCYCGRVTKVDLDDLPLERERCEFAAHHQPRVGSFEARYGVRAPGVPSPVNVTTPGRVTLTIRGTT